MSAYIQLHYPNAAEFSYTIFVKQLCYQVFVPPIHQAT